MNHYCYRVTKWFQAVASKRACEVVVANFIQDNIICKFAIPKHIFSDNGDDHVKSNPYSNGNEQAKANNKTLHIFSRMNYEEPKRREDFVPFTLWTYRTSKAYFNSSHVFLSSYWAEVLVPDDVMVHLTHLALPSKVFDPNDRIYDVEGLEEKRQNTRKKYLSY